MSDILTQDRWSEIIRKVRDETGPGFQISMEQMEIILRESGDDWHHIARRERKALKAALRLADATEGKRLAALPSPPLPPLTNEDREHLESIATFMEGQWPLRRAPAVERDITFLHRLASQEKTEEAADAR